MIWKRKKVNKIIDTLQNIKRCVVCNKQLGRFHIEASEVARLKYPFIKKYPFKGNDILYWCGNCYHIINSFTMAPNIKEEFIIAYKVWRNTKTTFFFLAILDGIINKKYTFYYCI